MHRQFHLVRARFAVSITLNFDHGTNSDNRSYMGIDLPNNRIVHWGSSRQNPVWLCTLDYVAAGFVSVFSQAGPSELAGRLIGFNELRPTTLDIENAMAEHAGRRPEVADDTVENMVSSLMAKAVRLAARSCSYAVFIIC